MGFTATISFNVEGITLSPVYPNISSLHKESLSYRLKWISLLWAIFYKNGFLTPSAFLLFCN